MKFFKPVVHLVLREIENEPNQLLLHVVTFCDRTSYRGHGHEEIPTELDENNVLNIDLNIDTEIDLPDFESITPIVHTLSFEESLVENGTISVNVFVNKDRNTDKPKPRASTVVSPTEADEEGK